MNLHHLGRVVLGYLALKGEKSSTLFISGLVTNNDEEKKIQIKTYKEWHQRAIELTGQLEIEEEKLKQRKNVKLEVKFPVSKLLLKAFPRLKLGSKKKKSLSKRSESIDPYLQSQNKCSALIQNGTASHTLRKAMKWKAQRNPTNQLDSPSLTRNSEAQTGSKTRPTVMMYSPQLLLL